ncbi:hypothetical protein ACFQPF_08055 [Fictibacillus iocasae]|uniref:DUF3139 domain-containing protein n=1 Tax=Fictibacillus iocasae TaxID=2715437 RepID=A0ABW2NLX3_9BACL
MKKLIMIVMSLFFLFAVMTVVIEYNKKAAFGTDIEEALYHSDKNTYSIQKILHKEMFAEEKYGYILFLTDDPRPYDSIVLAEFEKTIVG